MNTEYMINCLKCTNNNKIGYGLPCIGLTTIVLQGIGNVLWHNPTHSGRSKACDEGYDNGKALKTQDITIIWTETWLSAKLGPSRAEQR
jgi:hypothetical protein